MADPRGPRWRRSAAYRIAFAASAAFALAVAVLGLLVFLAADTAFRAQQDAALAETSAELVAEYRAGGVAELTETLRRRGGRTGVVTFGYALFDPAGRRIAGDFDVAPPPPGLSDIGFHDPVEGPDTARALATRLDGGRLLVVGIDAQALERLEATILSLFAVAFVAALLLGTLGALVLGGYLRRRLERIGGTARAIVDGDLDRRVPVSAAGDEFDAAGAAINAMLDRIARLMENLRQVSADVAHDLRTPLVRLRSRLEEARDHAGDGRAAAAIDEALAQSEAILTLFAGILRIVEVDTGELNRGFVPVDLSLLANDLCDGFAHAVADGGRRLACAIAADVTLAGHRELLAQAIANLLDNAQVHTPPGTAIELRLSTGPEQVTITVTDDGPGVPLPSRDRIVERFVRLDRSRPGTGHGLGLNLVDAVARAHGGRLVVADAAPGLAVSLILPRRS